MVHCFSSLSGNNLAYQCSFLAFCASSCDFLRFQVLILIFRLHAWDSPPLLPRGYFFPFHSLRVCESMAVPSRVYHVITERKRLSMVYGAFTLTWSVSMQISLHKKRVQLPHEWFGAPTRPLFHCFGTPIWPL